jgi:hypothetical protein
VVLEDDMVRDGKASLARRLSMVVSAGARRAIDRDGSEARRSTMEGRGRERERERPMGISYL